MCDGYIFYVFCFFKEICGQKWDHRLKAKRKRFETTGYHPTSRLEKNEKKKKKKTATVVGIHIYIQPPSLIIPNPHPLPASSTSCTSDIFGGKAKGFILWEKPKTRNLKLLQNNDLWLPPCLHPRMTHIHKARSCNKQWRPPGKQKQGHWPGAGGPWRDELGLRVQRCSGGKLQWTTSKAGQAQR